MFSKLTPIIRSGTIAVSLILTICRSQAAIQSLSSIEANERGLEHGLNYGRPATVWDEAMPLGNGILGALVWGDGQPLKISLDRTDLWDLRPVPEFRSPEYTYRQMLDWHHAGRHKDLIRLYEQPYDRAEAPTKIPAGRIELTFPGGSAFANATLSPALATATVELQNRTQVSVLVHATQPVGLIRVRRVAEISPRLVAPPFSGKGSLGKLGYPAPVLLVGENWQAFTQEGWQGFKFAVYLAWKRSGESWLGVWSVASSSEGDKPLEIARKRTQDALVSFEQMVTSHEAWWKDDYWAKSSVTLPNKTIERQWYLDLYKFGSASRRGAPPITLQGPWTADNGELPPWKGDYHHDLNTQLSYWPCYSGNHLEEGLSFLDWLWNTRSNCMDWTRRFFQMPGLNVPMTADLKNNPMGGWRQYTLSPTTAAWLSHHFYLHWRFSMDRDFLRERAYPYLKDAATFIEAVSRTRDADGKRTLPLSASPEIHDNKPNAWFAPLTNYDLALMRWLLGATAELADELKLTKDAQHWRSTLAEMPDFARGDDGRLLIAAGEPLPFSHRHFSHLMAIHPLGLMDREDGSEARRTIAASLAELDRVGSERWCGYSFAWLANLAARAGDGERAEKALEVFSTAFTLRNSFHCNGDQSGKNYSKFTYRPFTLEGNFAAAAGVQEMLLQSHCGKIVIFPAIPSSWKDVTFTSLRTEGAFLVSARRVGGVVQQVEITAEKGGTCQLVSPFSGKELKLEIKNPGGRVCLSSDQPIFMR